MPDLVLPYAVLGALWLPTLTVSRSSPTVPAAGEADRAVGRALAAIAGDEAHVVVAPDGDERTLREVAGKFSDQVLLDVGAVLPVPGRVAGVPGVALLDAVEAEQCLLVRTEGGSWAVVPQVEEFGSALEPGTLVRWRLFPFPFTERPVQTLLGLVGTVRQARQDLAEALTRALDAVDGLELAPGAGLAAEVLRSEVPPGLLPPGLDGPRVEVITRAARLLALTELAAADDDGTVVAARDRARAGVLAELREVARGALAAASVQHPARL